jgi:5-methylthioadenosine/S-adenosylhomocysteine deaminase
MTGAAESLTLLVGGDVVTMNPNRDVLLGGAVLLDGERIAAVGRTGELRAAYPQAGVVDASGCVVTPGMVNAHQHLTGDPLVRSCIPDLLAPGASIFEWAVPIHAHHTAADDELSATVCAVESLLNGVTTVVEAGTVAHPDAVAAAMGNVAARSAPGAGMWPMRRSPGRSMR